MKCITNNFYIFIAYYKLFMFMWTFWCYKLPAGLKVKWEVKSAETELSTVFSPSEQAVNSSQI